MSETATVEVLTAEVRVLMVGSRQVTLSVFKQLDEYDILDDLLEGFEVFGRVRSGAKYEVTDRTGRLVKKEANSEYVGRRKSTGALERIVVRPGERPLFDADDRKILGEWDRTLPLIVLAGLR